MTMCIICHNSASSDQNNRIADGRRPRPKRTTARLARRYEFKTMLHAIHSAGRPGRRPSIYRTRGIYAWAPKAATRRTGPQGADVRSSVDAGSCADHGLPRLRGGSGGGAVVPDAQPVPPDLSAGGQRLRGLPRHEASTRSPTRRKAVATTLDAGKLDSGTGTGTVWKNQLDDTLQGAIGGRLHELPQSTDAQGSCVPEWLDAADLRERTSDHPRYEVSLRGRGGLSGPPRSRDLIDPEVGCGPPLFLRAKTRPGQVPGRRCSTRRPATPATSGSRVTRRLQDGDTIALGAPIVQNGGRWFEICPHGDAAGHRG
ncbi:MAG: hypothetical protein MZV65_31315 [Chromatiales bacterium]|nr:hypothetical protein [Chromatiales bacterium]